MTEIKPSFLKAFGKTFGFFFVAGSLFFPLIAYLQGEPMGFYQAFWMGLICGGFLGAFGTVMFTPKKIEWNEEKITIYCLFPGTGEHPWDELQAYSSFGKKVGTFLIKFTGKQAYQINPLGFKKTEWIEFMSLLANGFPEKKRSIWLGPIPLK